MPIPNNTFTEIRFGGLKEPRRFGMKKNRIFVLSSSDGVVWTLSWDTGGSLKTFEITSAVEAKMKFDETMNVWVITVIGLVGRSSITLYVNDDANRVNAKLAVDGINGIVKDITDDSWEEVSSPSGTSKKSLHGDAIASVSEALPETVANAAVSEALPATVANAAVSEAVTAHVNQSFVEPPFHKGPAFMKKMPSKQEPTSKSSTLKKAKAKQINLFSPGENDKLRSALCPGESSILIKKLNDEKKALQDEKKALQDENKALLQQLSTFHKATTLAFQDANEMIAKLSATISVLESKNSAKDVQFASEIALLNSKQITACKTALAACTQVKCENEVLEAKNAALEAKNAALEADLTKGNDEDETAERESLLEALVLLEEEMKDFPPCEEGSFAAEKTSE